MAHAWPVVGMMGASVCGEPPMARCCRRSRSTRQCHERGLESRRHVAGQWWWRQGRRGTVRLGVQSGKRLQPLRSRARSSTRRLESERSGLVSGDSDGHCAGGRCTAGNACGCDRHIRERSRRSRSAPMVRCWPVAGMTVLSRCGIWRAASICGRCGATGPTSDSISRGARSDDAQRATLQALGAIEDGRVARL